MKRASLFARLREERGISAVFLAVTVFTLFMIGALAIDSGSLWTSRRNLVTGTDAAALDAANYFNSGGGNPCSGADVATAESRAKSVLLDNNGNAIHDATNTPNGFQVTTAVPCGSASYIPGKVRFDGRLNAARSLSGLLGISNLQAFSSSTAEWGYITGLGAGSGLRPMSVCDQALVTFPNPLPWPPVSPYPHYELWKRLQAGTITQAQYDQYFGSVAGEYPSVSSGFTLGDSSDNPNVGKSYVAPDGTNGHHTIHRITMPDNACGVVSGNRLWLDFTGPGSGTIGASELTAEILHGYQGEVDLTPHDCNPSDSKPAPEDCGSKPGNNASVANAASQALGTITCPVNVAALSCPYIFPILVASSVYTPSSGGGSNANYTQVAFLFVVLRGFGQIVNNQNLQLDYEFVSVQTDGNVGATPPPGNDVALKGVQMCGVDHDTQTDRCGF